MRAEPSRPNCRHKATLHSVALEVNFQHGLWRDTNIQTIAVTPVSRLRNKAAPSPVFAHYPIMPFVHTCWKLKSHLQDSFIPHYLCVSVIMSCSFSLHRVSGPRPSFPSSLAVSSQGLSSLILIAHNVFWLASCHPSFVSPIHFSRLPLESMPPKILNPSCHEEAQTQRGSRGPYLLVWPGLFQPHLPSLRHSVPHTRGFS